MIEIILEKQSRIILFFKVSDEKEIESKIDSFNLNKSFYLKKTTDVLEGLRINSDEIRKIYYD